MGVKNNIRFKRVTHVVKNQWPHTRLKRQLSRGLLCIHEYEQRSGCHGVFLARRAFHNVLSLRLID